jgi:ankyrin repeat protein
MSELVQQLIQDGQDLESIKKALQLQIPGIDTNYCIGEAFRNAIFRGNEAVVRRMLDVGVSPRTRDQCDPLFTPLFVAAQYGRLEIATCLWKLIGPEGRFRPGKMPQLSCLQVAARSDHGNLVTYFLDVWSGWTDDEKRWTLYDAALSWSDDVVALLLTRIDYDPETIQTALQRGVRISMILPEDPLKPRYTAKDSARQQNLVSRLIDAGADPNVRPTRPSGSSLIHDALSESCIGALEELLKRGANPNAQDSRGRTALHYLFHNTPKSPDTLRFLLHYGANPELSDADGETALHRAAFAGTLAHLQLCLSHTPDAATAIQSCNSHTESLLHYAAAGGKHDIVDFLLAQGLDIDAPSATGWTPLLCALSATNTKNERTMYALATHLLDCGANARVVTREDWTPLHALVSWPEAFCYMDPGAGAGAAPLAQRLIALGSSISSEPRMLRDHRVTPEMLLGVWGWRMQGVLGKGVEKEEDRKGDATPLMWAVRAGSMEVVNVIRAHLDDQIQV